MGNKNDGILFGAMVVVFFVLFALVDGIWLASIKQREAAVKLRRLSREYRVENVDRITLCSMRDFGGKTATGKHSGVNQVAISPDLKKFVGWYAIIPDVSDEIFVVSDFTNSRLRSTVDIYTYQPTIKAKEFGVRSGQVVFISPEGIKILGGL